MREFRLAPIDFLVKMKSARRDVADVVSLRKQDSLIEGMSFIVERTLFVWVLDDLTPDDGVISVRPESISESSPGRFRRTGFGLPR